MLLPSNLCPYVKRCLGEIYALRFRPLFLNIISTEKERMVCLQSVADFWQLSSQVCVIIIICINDILTTCMVYSGSH